MSEFSKASRGRLDTCHPDLIRLMEEVIRHVDITILCGARSVEEQKELYRQGKSKLDGVNKMSKHNHVPSLAVDFSPWKVRWERERFIAAAYFAKGIASQMGIKVRLGCDWNADLSFDKSEFFDGPHIELVGVEDDDT